MAAGSSDGQLGDFRRQLEATTERLLESSAAAAVQLCEERAAKEEAKRALESATAEILKLREAAQAKEAESERRLRPAPPPPSRERARMGRQGRERVLCGRRTR